MTPELYKDPAVLLNRLRPLTIRRLTDGLRGNLSGPVIKRQLSQAVNQTAGWLLPEHRDGVLTLAFNANTLAGRGDPYAEVPFFEGYMLFGRAVFRRLRYAPVMYTAETRERENEYERRYGYPLFSFKDIRLRGWHVDESSGGADRFGEVDPLSVLNALAANQVPSFSQAVRRAAAILHEHEAFLTVIKDQELAVSGVGLAILHFRELLAYDQLNNKGEAR